MVLWVFGYGSLIWNPGFDFDEKLIGYIKDYKRVFDLGMFFFFETWISVCFQYINPNFLGFFLVNKLFEFLQRHQSMLLKTFPLLQRASIIEARLNILQELARWSTPPEQYV